MRSNETFPFTGCVKPAVVIIGRCGMVLVTSRQGCAFAHWRVVAVSTEVMSGQYIIINT